MVTAGAAGVVYVAGAVLVAALVDVRAHAGRSLHLEDRHRSLDDGLTQLGCH
jgi:hypothetical protein